MARLLSQKQTESSLYIIGQITPLVLKDEQGNVMKDATGSPIGDSAAIMQRIAEIHQEPGRGPGPDCGCGKCVAEHGCLGPEIPDPPPPSDITMPTDAEAPKRYRT